MQSPQPVIFMDYQSTTPIDPRVVDVMMPYLSEHYGNPHSRTHAFGWRAEEAVHIAREQTAQLINANAKEIIFTSGATEANNLAIKGVANHYKEKKRHIITVETEHSCVLESCRHLECEGFEVTYLPVRGNGLIDLNQLAGAFRSDTLLVSIMAVNNEIGVIQPLQAIGELCRHHRAFFHSDAAQAFGKVPLDVEAMHIDLLSISAHKVYGPKGIGALYTRRRPRVRLQPLFSGGGQERGVRSGTTPTHLAVGLGEAARIAQSEMDEEYAVTTKLFHNLYTGIVEKIPDARVNGDLEQRYKGNLNVGFADLHADSLLMHMRELAVSTGSACTSAELHPSHVLDALGIDKAFADSAIRFGIGRFTTEEEVARAVAVTQAAVHKLRSGKETSDVPGQESGL